MHTVEVYGWECIACGEWVDNDVNKPLSGCRRHKSGVSWAPHQFGFDFAWERPGDWHAREGG